MEEKKYQILYVDPAWSYNDKRGKKRRYGSAEAYYPTMSLEELKAIQIPAADNCVLFMWATMPMLPDALELMRSWGFTYKTVAFTWVKTTGATRHYFYGMGNWTRSNAELCLLGTKGKISRANADVEQIIEAPIRRHSEKPDIARRRIVRLMGDLPRIELFAREAASGWSSWGNDPSLTNQEKL